MDVVGQTPNLNFASPVGEGNNAIFSMRGVSLTDFAENNEGPVAVYTDEVYVATLAGLAFQTYDLERVEVLRGPQGTLYGRNSTGGLIHYISTKPSQVTEGYINGSYGSHNQVRIEGAVGGGLSEDFSARVSVLYNRHDPYVENRIGPDTNEADAYSGRLQLLYEPTGVFSVGLKSYYGRTDTVAPSYQHSAIQVGPSGLVIDLLVDEVNPACAKFIGLTEPGQDCLGYSDRDGDPCANDIDRPGFLDVESYGFTGKVDATFDGFSVTSITSN